MGCLKNTSFNFKTGQSSHTPRHTPPQPLQSSDCELGFTNCVISDSLDPDAHSRLSSVKDFCVSVLAVLVLCPCSWFHPRSPSQTCFVTFFPGWSWVRPGLVSLVDRLAFLYEGPCWGAALCLVWLDDHFHRKASTLNSLSTVEPDLSMGDRLQSWRLIQFFSRNPRKLKIRFLVQIEHCPSICSMCMRIYASCWSRIMGHS